MKSLTLIKSLKPSPLGFGLIAVSAFAVASLREMVNQRRHIEYLTEEKSKFDQTMRLIQNIVKTGGWLEVQVNGQLYPFGVLVDKLEPITDKIQ